MVALSLPREGLILKLCKGGLFFFLPRLGRAISPKQVLWGTTKGYVSKKLWCCIGDEKQFNLISTDMVYKVKRLTVKVSIVNTSFK